MPLDASTSITITVNGNSYQIWDEGLGARLNRFGLKSKGYAKWRCPWNQAAGLCRDLLGGSTFSGPVTTYNNSYQFSEFGGLVCLDINLTGDGVPSVGSNGFIQYERALLELTFGYPEYAGGNAGTNIGVLSIDYGEHAYELPAQYQKMFQTTGIDPVMVGLSAYTIKVAHLEYGLFNRAYLNVSGLLGYFNTVNSAPMPIFGAGIGQIMFNGCRTQYKMTIGNLPNWDISLSFSFNPVADWNYMPIPGFNPIFQKVVDINGNPRYSYADLNSLSTFF